MPSEPLAFQKFKQSLLVLGVALLLGGLLLFAYLSVYNRHWADDWCYNADFRNKGFLDTVAGYAYDVTYTPSRYSVTIFAGLKPSA
jgi:drug/metabolite transporter (DMT)-like permease